MLHGVKASQDRKRLYRRDPAVDFSGFYLSILQQSYSQEVFIDSLSPRAHTQCFPAYSQSPLVTEIALVTISEKFCIPSKHWIWCSLAWIALSTGDSSFQLEIVFSGSPQTSFPATICLTSHSFFNIFTDFPASHGLWFLSNLGFSPHHLPGDISSRPLTSMLSIYWCWRKRALW